MVYRRRELWLLLFFTVSLGAGLAVRQFRTGFPELADRLEHLDREDPPLPVTPSVLVPSRVAKRSGHQAEHGPKAQGRAGEAEGPLDLNQATAEDLQRLPGIGPILAGQIIRARERRGRFTSPQDLLAVPGIGPKKLDGIRDLVTAGDGRGAKGRTGENARDAGTRGDESARDASGGSGNGAR